jgi:hypothetical protein
LGGDFEALHLFIADSGGFEGFKLESKNAESVVDIHFGNSKGLSFAKRAD